MNTELSSVELNRLFHKLTSAQMESISGGNTVIPLWSSNDTIFGNDLNGLLSKYFSSLGFYNNKILTIDFSNIDIYLVV
ncbi:hypothetical protein H6G54_24825 [Anabaena cylindrica FACHB-243]|uniref:Uncharacterized protein n=1 Tax=Anabaena cylindrica (strain ATCC 27899 / PCC 7122) TaxID=272123 RepID=K9ZF58_ANACC|nr:MULTISPECIES: hypothetical protein [Anabaena]AFZ57197.1 hypothetical protein Anacy_1698 [Anabaena cylindrica PCC 7122]MBD2420868.1 hypothetical protein [Anabaena cylindrica FACHB-243]MBY5285399.1 hypothetical protein [Anabaena sp. CCAP 1446/1C]MBY5311387.1 hypothetical protein [Anabaena sp. CCAP 1446/1C]MCM2405616.1 hypothetical protein [Anabaena sp. CCAP 1446/1C]